MQDKNEFGAAKAKHGHYVFGIVKVAKMYQTVNSNSLQSVVPSALRYQCMNRDDLMNRELSELAPYRYVVLAFLTDTGVRSASFHPLAHENAANISNNVLATDCLVEDAWYTSLLDPRCLRLHTDRSTAKRFYKISSGSTLNHPQTDILQNLPLYVDEKGAAEISRAFNLTNKSRNSEATAICFLRPHEEVRLGFCVDRMAGNVPNLLHDRSE